MTFRELHSEIMTANAVPPEAIRRMQRDILAFGRPIDLPIPDEHLPALREYLDGMVKLVASDPIARAAVYLALKPQMDKRTQNN